MKFKGQEAVKALVPLMTPKFVSVAPSINPKALAQRDELVTMAVAVATVADAAEQDEAGAAVRALRQRVKAVKAARLELTKPLNDDIALAIQIEREYCGPLEEQVTRIESLANGYQDKLDDEAAKAEQVRQADIKRLADEKRVLEAAAELATTPKQELKAEAKVEAAREELHDALRTVPWVPQKAKGQTRRDVMNVEVVDAAAAYKANPHFFRLEPLLNVIKSVAMYAVPKTVNEAAPETTKWPGIKAYWSKEGGFRS